MTTDDKTSKELRQMINLIMEQIHRAYRMGYSDGVEDALDSVQKESDRKEKLSQP